MKCLICGKEYQKLGRHLISVHYLTSKEYYDKYLKKDGEGFCIICGKPVKFYRINNGYPRHCLSCVSKDPNIKMKKQKTYMDHFGVDNPMKNSDIKDKYKNNNYQKYGYEWPMERSDVRQKSIETCIQKYGVENINHLHETKLKKEKSNLKNRGVKYPTQCKKVLKKSRKTSIHRYGVEHWSQTDEGRQICRENFIRMIENEKLNGETLYGRVGDDERKCLKELQKYTDFEILRNRQLIGYIPDGFIGELNLVIEFDERYHFVDDYQTYCEHDIQKNKDYKNSGYNCFRIKKVDWEQNKNIVIHEFKTILEMNYARK